MVFNNNLLLGAAGQSTGYEIDQSIRFDKTTSSHLSKTYGSAGNRRTWTFSTWFKRGKIDGTRQSLFAAGGPAYLQIGPDSASREMITILNEGSGTNLNWYTTQVFRDPSAWYHLVWQFDSTQASGDDRTKLYINGSQVTDFTKAVTPSLNLEGAINNAVEHKIGELHIANYYFDGYQAEINFIDGTALDASSFGEYNADGVWIPKKYSGSYGSNGFYITGATASDLGEDFSGNNNDFTSSGLATTDQMPDTPTNNFCTLNPVEPTWGGAVTLSDGNLALAGTSSTPWNNAIATFKTLPSTGKWIWASEPNTSGAGRGDPWIVNETGLASRNNYVYIDANGWETTFDTASVKASLNNSATIIASHSYGAGDFHVVCFDADSKKLWFGLYDVSASQLKFQDSSGGFTGDPAAGTNQTYTLTGNEFSIGFATFTGRSGVVDFGQSNLLSQFTAPTDFKTLNTANLPTPSITDGSAYFQPTLYSGNSSTQEVNQSGNSTFQPDWLWVKSRSLGAGGNHVSYDAVRGVTKEIYPNLTNTEGTTSALTSFDADGFTLLGAASGSERFNKSGETYVAWQWKANGSGSSNTDGSTSSTVSADTTSGFSIATYTGTGSAATIGHGLGVAPAMVIVKKRDSGTDDAWIIWHQELPGANYYLNFDTGAQDTSVNYWNNTLPTSSVFSVGASNGTNQSSKTFVAYCFAEIPGYSSFGGYKGNGSTDGTFVYTGFSPAFIMYKVTSTTDSWEMYDTTRQTSNVYGTQLKANLSNAETDDTRIDILSNGFKARSTNTAVNASGATYIYMAFAENPFGGDGVVAATAR